MTAANSAVTYAVTVYLIEVAEQVDAAELPPPFRQRLNEVADRPDNYRCWDCCAPIGWVLDDGGPTARCFWSTVALASTGDAVAALCEDCAPDSPTAPYVGDSAAADRHGAELRAEAERLRAQVAAVRALCRDAMKLPTMEDPRPADDRVSPRAVLAALDVAR